jgi:hypothetical protein
MHQSLVQFIVFDGHYEDVVHVDKYHSWIFVTQAAEDSIHCSLKGGWQICKTEEHDFRLIESIKCFESRLPSVFLFDKHVIIPHVHIKYHEEFLPM